MNCNQFVISSPEAPTPAGGQGNALPVIAKPPPHLRYVPVKCGEAIQG
ncbi:MAG: hypothetical protein LBM98_06305 [Oscillospiraceae bacterium]|nr:hypothetical protein [Oscillospiraceae bacterium]